MERQRNITRYTSFSSFTDQIKGGLNNVWLPMLMFQITKTNTQVPPKGYPLLIALGLQMNKQVNMTHKYIQVKANIYYFCETKQNQSYTPIEKTKKQNLMSDLSYLLRWKALPIFTVSYSCIFFLQTFHFFLFLWWLGVSVICTECSLVDIFLSAD